VTHSNLLIIGSGMAGYTLLRELRKLDKDQGITLICADSGDFYPKPMLSNALAQGKTPDQLVTLAAEAMIAGQQFELVANTRVDSIDPENKLVRSGQRSWSYDRLVLAIGANPIAPPMQGNAADAVVTVNHLDDYRVFRQKLDGAQRVAIIGPGLIGCEFANDLASQHIACSVIGPDPWPLSTLLPEAAGRLLQQKLEKQGVEFHLGTTVEAVDHADGGLRLTLDNRQHIEADCVLSAIGLRPNTQLARDAGLEVRRGIVCDRFLATSDASIFALGDCAEVNGYNLPYIMPIMHAARALARTLSGQPTEVSYPVMPVAIKTPACPLVVAPPADPSATSETTHDDDSVKVTYHAPDGSLRGFVLAGQAVSEKQALARELPGLF
jgi:rubredoxin-NAD+ reductase